MDRLSYIEENAEPVVIVYVAVLTKMDRLSYQN